MSKKAAKKKAPAKKTAAKKPKAEKKEGADAPVAAPVVKVTMEPSPVPNVLSRYDGTMHERRAKGYSQGELASVGLTKVLALSLDVPIDVRRRSTLQDNVDALKGWYKPAPKKPAAPRTDKAEKSAKPSKKSASKKSKKE
jgi:ribosomal protein L13E